MSEALQVVRSTRDLLLEVAGRLFAERGFDGVSIRDITREAGVNLGAVTYHFGSKVELFRAIIIEKTKPLSEIGRRIAQTDQPPREKLSQLLHESALHILNRDPYLKAFFAEAMQGGERLSQECLEPLVQRNRLIASIIQEGIDSGVFRACDVEGATWAFFGMLVPYVLHQPMITPERRLGAYPEAFVRRVVDTATDLFFDGLEKKP